MSLTPQHCEPVRFVNK